ncbi:MULTISPECIES: hypothetical protein [unclassified Mesorhizobium]|uniref:hypothetical protein n=1 Tax=unclassified Mesorhizobium TaxID=325217 RepID=UPI000FCCA599|nr:MULTISPECIES: hypothetical protein [unclassified Mesorhizobium]RUV44622.1 hypothetical protein EOD29_07610 [Mesorhizobium sp. M1A.T.Ca.IN.004.03.1.1]RWK27847.1 MAG: hypothetical protein EOR40_29195 [Mesorhizobium sp.]RWK86772.1 MAG: hypothetical protein EOR52_20825 [Mesorhizobium sp.]TIP21615.1 MAG: hypothetical protein E5X66_02335 [Mesorhizobium sp.]TJV86874.1 MAG: hypothetical protein E5X45_01055 [Mesorhizobium sp.]
MVRLAAYDYRELGKLLRAKLEEDGRGWRACAGHIGVSASDLSRICNGQSVSAPKVIAVCDWLKLSFRAFYLPPPHDTGAMFHGTSTETGSTCDAC